MDQYIENNSRKERILKKWFEKSVRRIQTAIIDNNQSPEWNGEIIDIQKEIAICRLTLGDFVTLNWEFRANIKKTQEKIRNYKADNSLKRPLNFLLFAKPGTGKSHLVKCLAESITGINTKAVTFNMATFSNIEDFIQPLEQIRNLKVQDYLPILFIDEFDKLHKDYSPLLPLLWDGELNVGHFQLKLGKMVIIMAGSSASIKAMISDFNEMRQSIWEEKYKDHSNKVLDLLSRINGGIIEFPDIDCEEVYVDRVCLALSLLQQRFGPYLYLVPLSLLNIICVMRFRYGARSISHLINKISYKAFRDNKLNLEELDLPITSEDDIRSSSLVYHILSNDGLSNIADKWNMLKKGNIYVRINSKESEDQLEFD